MELIFLFLTIENIGIFVLNAVAKHSGLMEKDGREWRFLHQLIQDYFGGRYVVQTVDKVCNPCQSFTE
jgi:hypothetical protein